MDRDEVGITVLSAGASQRMGHPKALLQVEGQPLLSNHLQLYRDLGFNNITVVLGFWEREIRAAVNLHGVRVIVNPAPERGQFSSLQCAVEEMDLSRKAEFVTPVDCPPVPAAVFVCLLEQARMAGHYSVCVPTFLLQAGHPIVLSGEALCRIREAPADASLQQLLQNMAEIIYLEVASDEILANLNTPADYQNFLGGNSIQGG